MESLLSSPIIVQRMVHCQWQTRKSSALSEITNAESPEEAEVSRDSTFPKRVDSLGKLEQTYQEMEELRKQSQKKLGQ